MLFKVQIGEENAVYLIFECNTFNLLPLLYMSADTEQPVGSQPA